MSVELIMLARYLRRGYRIVKAFEYMQWPSKNDFYVLNVSVKGICPIYKTTRGKLARETQHANV